MIMKALVKKIIWLNVLFGFIFFNIIKSGENNKPKYFPLFILPDNKEDLNLFVAFNPLINEKQDSRNLIYYDIEYFLKKK
jgi:hypothetical protein